MAFATRALCGALSFFALTACGGGSSSSASGSGPVAGPMAIVVPTDLTVDRPDALTLQGSASSTAGALSSMSWTLEALTLGANWVSAMGNADCRNAEKSTSGSEWNCTLSLTPPTQLSADYVYRLTLNAKDVKGNSASSSMILTVRKEAATAFNPVAHVGDDASVTSGDRVALACTGSGGTPATPAAGSSDGYAYQWVIADAADLDFKLSTPNSKTASFTAPVVSAATTLKLQCRVTDDKARTGTAIQTVTVNPLIKPTVIPISTSGGIAQAGSSATLDGTKSMLLDANGKATGGTLYYLWVQKTGPLLPISNPTTSVASIVFPKLVNERTAYVFTMYVSTAPIDSAGHSSDPIKQVDVAYYVDPLPAIALVSYQPTQTVQSGASVTLKVDAPANTYANIVYYSWTQIAGPAVQLAGANSNNAGFIAPVVTANAVLIFRVSAGYAPITVANPGTAFLDVIVQVTPLPKS